MSRKPRTTRVNTRTITVVPEQPAHPDVRAVGQPASARPQAPAAEQQLTGQIARGAASGIARAVTDWIIEQITAHLQ
ncbi:hypothetical protein [Kitasatospora sp. NPDC057015]|uniref:hypothetical protein n=1 Tax=Kitasatospora sp. NPDC057015 TaxID=3346001 RepID=UPI0036439037